VITRTILRKEPKTSRRRKGSNRRNLM